MSRRNPMAAIEARQRAEEAQRHMEKITAENSKMKMMGRWESSTAKRVASTEYYQTMDRIQARQDDVLVQRRERLAAMLLQEKADHDSMIAGLAETDEQRKDRLMQHARDLRKQREEHRQGQSNQRKDLLAVQRSAAVREAESRLKVLQAADERHRQLELNEQARANKAEEERFFTEQWLEQQKLQNARARQDLEDQHVRGRQRQNDLAVQLENNQVRKEEEKARLRQDDAEFFHLLKEEQQKEFQKQELRRQHRTELAKEMKERNEELRAIKQNEYERLRFEDKQLLDDILREIAITEKKEAEVKRKARQEAVDHMHRVEAQMGEQAESETALDKLWQEENDREWAKKEARWMEDQDRRQRLLKNVMENRKNQVIAIREREGQEAQRRREEHEDMVRTLQKMRDEDMTSARDRLAQHRKVQDYLAKQIAVRDKERSDAEMNRKTALTDTQAEEFRMRDAIEAELRRLEEAKPDRYKAVMLQRNKKGLAALENF